MRKTVFVLCNLVRDLVSLALPDTTHSFSKAVVRLRLTAFPFSSTFQSRRSFDTPGPAQGRRAERRIESMRFQPEARGKTVAALIALALVVIGQLLWAQNLGSAPASNVAVQGQTGAQPEGAFLNFINWIGNVIAPVGAGGAVLGAVVSWLTGRGFGRWLFAAAALLAISGLTRLIEFWITNGTSGVT
jgi:hypothetical protein